MNIHKVIIPNPPDSIKEFFDAVERIDRKIYRGEDYTTEIKKMTNDSTEIQRSIQGQYGKK